ncbi:MAG TPA: hypothetical protein VHR18_02450 [Solirubrobacterales bacterium]|jgi:hypothetical protein|nr:hypothetical protein [Solirubrobacterales bacterium]
MLSPGRYLLGVVEVAILVGFAWAGTARVRARLLPRFEGAPAFLATAVLALALLLWAAELLGTVSLFEPLPYLLLVAAVGLALWKFLPRQQGEGDSPHPSQQVWVRRIPLPTLVALLVAVVALAHFGWDAKPQLSAGMTGFDSTWYHGPFAAGFFQSGNTIDLHFIAPQFLAWFYPANGEIFHAVGMGAFGRDLLSPLLNIGWFAGCLLASWCIGRPYRVAPWSLALGAIALSVPALSDQAGEARNDIVGIFFLLAAVAVAINAWALRDERGFEAGPKDGLGSGGMPGGALAVAGLAVGLAAGTKLNFLLPAVVFVVGLAVIAPRGSRWRAFAVSGLGALAGGGYWYLRNLVQTGNPLPWVDSLGPISLPAPEQALGGREAHSVLSYLTDGTVWSDWFLPGLQAGLWFLWPLLAAAALAGLILCVTQAAAPRSRGSFRSQEGKKEPRDGEGESRDRILALVGLVGLATALAWLVAPTSASGPDGMPRGFESGLRYLAPALVLGLVLLPVAPLLRELLAGLGTRLPLFAQRANKDNRTGRFGARAWALMMGLVALAVMVVVGFPVQRHYLEGRYADPSFTTPGLNAAFAWANDVSDSRIATTSTRQYPLFGADLSNRVAFVGEERPHGGFEAPATCPAYRALLNAGDYDYVVASKDREEPGKPPYPPQARWTESPSSRVILRTPPTVVFGLSGPLDPAGCP